MRSLLRRAALTGLLGGQILGAQSSVRESDVEAAYLCKFGKFMRTPSHADASFTLCTLGANPFGTTLEQLAAHDSVDGRPMRVVHLSGTENVRTCDVLFVGESEFRGLGKRWSRWATHRC